MKYCPNCGKAGVEGMKFCPHCGQRLAASSLEQNQTYVTQSATRSRQASWFERHLNWTMFLAFVAAYVIAFVVGFIIASSDPYISEDALYIVGVIVGLAVLIPVWGWVLRRKNRSLWWLPLGLFVPFGWIVLLYLENRSQATKSLQL